MCWRYSARRVSRAISRPVVLILYVSHVCEPSSAVVCSMIPLLTRQDLTICPKSDPPKRSVLANIFEIPRSFPPEPSIFLQVNMGSSPGWVRFDLPSLVSGYLQLLGVLLRNRRLGETACRKSSSMKSHVATSRSYSLVRRYTNHGGFDLCIASTGRGRSCFVNWIPCL